MTPLKVGISERSEATGLRKGQRWEPQMQSSARPAPEDMIAVKGQGATSTEKTGETEAVIRPAWLEHIEAEPSFRDREAVQREAAFHKLHHQGNGTPDAVSHHTTPILLWTTGNKFSTHRL